MPEEQSDEYWMGQALILAQSAADAGEVPVGAVVVSATGELLGSGFNQPIRTHDPSAHAEIMAIRNASIAVSNYRLPGCVIYVTIEPCTMCIGAIVHSRIARVVYGAPEPRFGAIESGRRLLDEGAFNHRVEYIGGVQSQQCGELMRDFFKGRRSEAQKGTKG